MKEFWNDYINLWNECGKFYKKHWKGCLVLNAAIIGAEVAYFAYQNKKFEKSIQGDLSKEIED
jgi:hypothetical protein